MALASALPGATVLDLGCGIGGDLVAMARAGLVVHGVERDPLTALYRALRGAGDVRGEAFEAVLRGEGSQPRSAALAGRLVRVLSELDLVVLDREGQALRVADAPARTALERSPAFRAYHQRLEDGLTYLTSDTTRRQAA